MTTIQYGVSRSVRGKARKRIEYKNSSFRTRSDPTESDRFHRHVMRRIRSAWPGWIPSGYAIVEGYRHASK